MKEPRSLGRVNFPINSVAKSHPLRCPAIVASNLGQKRCASDGYTSPAEIRVLHRLSSLIENGCAS